MIVTDDDVDVRDWSRVIRAVSTCVDQGSRQRGPRKHANRLPRLSSPLPSLGSKLGIDATNKWPDETTRTWSKPIALDDAVEERVDAM